MPESRENIRYFVIGAVSAILVAVVVWFVWPVGPTLEDPSPARSADVADKPGATTGTSASTPDRSPMPWAKAEPGRPALEPVAQVNASAPRSPLADSLNQPGKSGSEDIRVVYSLLTYYRKTFGSFPTGEDNRQIVNALAGNNPKGLAILPRDHPAINAAGELVDRWQTPFFFHIISRENVEVRSAGADREMWTEDDLLVGQKASDR